MTRFGSSIRSGEETGPGIVAAAHTGSGVDLEKLPVVLCYIYSFTANVATMIAGCDAEMK
jgi:hypothetical protein